MRLITNNLVSDSSTLVSSTSQNTNFPTSNLKHEFRSKVWRSKGTFVIDATNNKINFKDESSGSELTATLDAGTYSVSGLQTEISAQLADVGAGVYSVTFSEATGLWTLSSDQVEFELLNASGTDASESTLTNALGFPATDKTGSTSYTGSSIAIHTKERITFDMITTEPVDSVALLWPKEDGIKLSNTAVIKVEANATNNWSSPAVSQTLTIDNLYSMATHYFTTDQTYRYWSITIEDPANPYLYVELGVAFIGKSLEIDPPENGFKFGITDNSRVSRTEYGHDYVDEYPLSLDLSFAYKYMEYDDIVALETAYRINGTRKPVFVTLDATESVFAKNHYALYGKFESKFGVGHVLYNLLDTDLKISEVS